MNDVIKNFENEEELYFDEDGNMALYDAEGELFPAETLALANAVAATGADSPTSLMKVRIYRI